MPLIELTAQDAPSSSTEEDDIPTRRSWYLYLPLAFAIFFILMPHPSFLLMVSSHYLRSHYSPLRFTIHLLNVYATTILSLISLTICVVRDPGSVTPSRGNYGQAGTNGRAEGTDQALLYASDDDDEAEDALSPREIDELWLKGLWCKKCKHTRPERAHHCSVCNRCILKMDHHCPWIGANCVGHRTYPAFIHFVFMCTVLSCYITGVAVAVIVSLVQDPFSADPEFSPLHALFLALVGAVFAIVMGSFLVYHFYLVTTGQTTLEHISPFHLLRYLPPPLSSPKPPGFPPPPSSANGRQSRIPSNFVNPQSPIVEWDSPVEASRRAFPLRPDEESTSMPLRYCPPEEHQLTHSQRRLVKYCHGRIRIYDLGWKHNWGEVFGGGQGKYPPWKWWLMIIACGGQSRGDGKYFEKARGAQQRLQKFSNELEEIGRTERLGHRGSN